MNLHVSKNMGFCFGVRRAVERASKVLSDGNGRCGIYSVGALIHNPQVVEELAQRGLKVVNDLSGVDSGTLILRSHGVRPETIKEAEGKGLEVIDVTCPFVKRSQEITARLKREGYKVIIVGEKTHPEVLSLLGYSGDEAIVLSRPSEAKGLSLNGVKACLLAQTTQDQENFRGVISAILDECPLELRIFNTICNDTTTRRREATEIASQVEVMIVVGGKNSANTKRLADACRRFTEVHHIETAGELEPSWIEAISSIGITSGASTPRDIVEDVVKKLSERRVNNCAGKSTG